MEHFVGGRSEFADGRRRIVTVNEKPIGVFLHDGELFAYRNVCPHQGGPVCEGLLIGRVEEEVDEMGRVGEARFSEEAHLACPWHGMEFDLRSGVSWSDPRRRLRRHDVIEREDGVYVVVD